MKISEKLIVDMNNVIDNTHVITILFSSIQQQLIDQYTHTLPTPAIAEKSA